MMAIFGFGMCFRSALDVLFFVFPPPPPRPAVASESEFSFRGQAYRLPLYLRRAWRGGRALLPLSGWAPAAGLTSGLWRVTS